MSSEVEVQILFNDLEALAAEIDFRTELVIRKVAADILASAQTRMRGSKSGRVYMRGKKPNQKSHQASAPGEAPAVDGGDLVGSGKAQMVSQTVGEVTFSAEEAELTEFGTRKMAPRPFLVPSLQEAEPALMQALGKIVSNA